MLIKLLDKNKDTILIETNNIVECSKHGGGANGINTKILLANVDRADCVKFVFETTDEIYSIERQALSDYRMVNNYVVKIPETKKEEPKIKEATVTPEEEKLIEEKKTLV